MKSNQKKRSLARVPPAKHAISAENAGFIELSGVSTANLKNITVRFSQNALVAVTGESGSGKSALIVKTLAAESERFLRVETRASALRNRVSHLEPRCDSVSGLLPVIVLPSTGLIERDETLSQFLGLDRLVGRIFQAYGMLRCGSCSGLLSTVSPAALAEIFSGSKATDLNGVLLIGAFFDAKRRSSFSSKGSKILQHFQKKGLRRFVTQDALYRFDAPVPALKKSDDLIVCNDTLPTQGAGRALVLNALMHALALGSDIGVAIEYLAGTLGRRWYFSREPFCPSCYRAGSGVGERVLDDVSYETLLSLQIDQLLARVPSLAHDDELVDRITTLSRLGLGSLELGRSTKKVSAGEALKLHLASALFQELSETLYVLDEPSRILHPLDLALVVRELRTLLAAGCGVVVIDRNVDFVRAADEVIELGGAQGGELLFNGPGSAWRNS